MKRNSKWLWIVCLLLLKPAFAFAHDGWIQVNPIIEIGQPAVIALMHGNHSNEHGSFRLAGKWDLKYTKVFVIGPKGELSDISAAVFDLGEDPEKTGPKGPKGFHLTQFAPVGEGVYTVIARQERVLQQGDGPRLRTMRNARAAFVALRNPRVIEARKAKGFDQTHRLEHLVEIIPVTNPFAVSAKGSLTLSVLLHGKPAPNQTVTVIGQIAGTSSAQDLKTDHQGRVRVSVGPADTYLARVKFDQENQPSKGRLEKDSYEATYVFSVFNHL